MDLGGYLDYWRDDDEAEAVLSDCVATAPRVVGIMGGYILRAEQGLALNLSKKGRPEQEPGTVRSARVVPARVLQTGLGTMILRRVYGEGGTPTAELTRMSNGHFSVLVGPC